ncbi:MAG: hypothetical protein RMM51_01590 [Verrucomicrobiae bacterium]|nr:hypothetical protein [Verrucomicrobiae bacterium]
MPTKPAPSFMEFRFRPSGPGRFATAGFLLFWLCGWLVGELIALAVLVTGLYSLITGQPPPGKTEPLELAPALVGGGFLLIWLAIWTIGGWAAAREFLRQVWAEDHIMIQPDGLLLVRRLGPFVKHQQIPRRDIRRIYVQPPRGELLAQVIGSPVILSDLGTTEERATAAQQLESALRLTETREADDGALPADWQEYHELRGGVVIAPAGATRRTQAKILAGVTAAGWSVVMLLINSSLREPTMWGLTAMVGALAVWLTRQTLWLFRGRKEWRIERGRIIHQRRYADEVTELGEARAIELTESVDSDHDHWYELVAILTDQPGKKPGRKITLHKTLHDPTEPRSFGRWLARRAAIPFHDRVPTDAQKQAELAELLTTLSQTGKVGGWLADRLKKYARRRSPNNH